MNARLITGTALAGLLLTAGIVGAVSAQSATETPTVTDAQAVEIALAEIPGTVQDTELDQEDGMTLYEIEILGTDGMTYEVEIDATSGAVIEASAEGEDDDDDGDQDKDHDCDKDA